MTAVARWLPHLIALLAIVAFVWTHRFALALPGFSDDIGLVHQLVDDLAAGRLWETLGARFTGPLWGPGSHMWRPWAFATFGLDAWLWGANPSPWRWMNLALHVAFALATALLAKRLLRHTLAAVSAFAVVLLNPWSAEITLWIVGRFDGWASAAIAGSVACAARSTRIDRWLIASALLAAIAYLSKESALLLPIAVLGAVIVRAVDGRSVESSATGAVDARESFWRKAYGLRGLLCLHGALALTYLALRRSVLGDAGLNAYGAPTPQSIADFIERIGHHFAVSATFFAAPTATLATIGVIIAGSLVWVLRERTRVAVFVVGAAIAIVPFAGAAWHFGTTWGQHADGGRIYYVAALGAALVVASAVASIPRVAGWCVLLLIGLMAISQDRTNRDWKLAGVAHYQLLAAIALEVDSMPEETYAVVLLPDVVGRVPWVRNANGAILREAQRISARTGRRYLDYMVAFLPQQLDELRGLLAKQDFLKLLTSRASAPLVPNAFFCYEPGAPTLTRLQGLHEVDSGASLQQWRAATNAVCPSLKL